MPRPIWKGSISFGLVNVPIVLFSAESREELHFTMLDARNKARVKYERINSVTNEPVPWDRIVKGYEYEEGSYVLLSNTDFKKAAPEATQTVEITDFVNRDEIDVTYYDKPYYIAPGKNGEKGYALLRETLKRSGKVGIAKVVIRTKQYLAAVIPEGDTLMLEILRFPYEIRDTSDLSVPPSDLKKAKVSAKEVELAQTLVDAMTGKWDPSKYHDEYRDALLQWIEKKVKAGDLEAAPEPEETDEEEPPAPINLMALLKKSVEGRAGTHARPGTHTAKPAPSTKTKTTRHAAPRKRKAG